MTEHGIVTRGAKVTIPPADLEALKAALRGTACLPGDARLRRGAHHLECDDRP